MTILALNSASVSSGDVRLSGLQIRTLLLCALAAFLDGNDTGAMGIGAPAIAASLHVAPSTMGWAFSGSWLGAAFGAIGLGWLADRIGRKAVLILSLVLFGMFTILTPILQTIPALIFLRVLAGFGLGGAAPCFIALSSEYCPARHRASVVSLIWAAFPLGLLVGGLFNGLILAWLPWPNLFYVGGTAPLILAAVSVWLLPESIGFLAAKQVGGATAFSQTAIMPDFQKPASVSTVPALNASNLNLAHLIGGGRLRATICLWILLFAAFGVTASMSWVPTTLRESGVSLAAASVAVSFLGLGALIGMAIAGRLVGRFGPARALVVPMVAGALATAGLGVWPKSPEAASVFVTLVGALVGLGASGGIALLALVYPIVMRSTGAGWALGIGRLGQVVLPAMFAILLHQGWSARTIFVILGGIPLIASGAAWSLESALGHVEHDKSDYDEMT